MQNRAFGVIDMLLTLLITSVIVAALYPILKGSSGVGNLNDTNVKSVQEQVDSQVDEITKIKEQAAQESEQLINGFN